MQPRVITRQLRELRTALAAFGWEAWLVAFVATLVAATAIGIPTRLIANPFFSRMTSVRAQDYVIWAASALLIGLIAGTFVAARGRGDGGGKVFGGGVLAYLAVGCPVCNKLVLLALGVSGALTYFAPLQLYLGIASVLLLIWTLLLRAGVLAGVCAVKPMQAPDRDVRPAEG